MTQEQFTQLSKELKLVAPKIPLRWGKVQNDTTDSLVNMFKIDSFAELNRQIHTLDDNSRNYFLRRWFLWQCSKCDEHIFLMNTNVRANPNPRDQEFDIEFNNDNELRFDIKGTVIPSQFRKSISTILKDPKELVEFFYREQSTGVRSNIQNRLFIVHHSFVSMKNEMILRCNWELKIKAFRDYSKRVNTNSNFIQSSDVKADVIFIFENRNRSFSYRFNNS